MTDPPPDADSGGGPSPGPDDTSPTGTPRWVKAFGLIAVAVVVLLVVAMLVGGGRHGPGRHLGGDGDIPRDRVTEISGHTPPLGVEHGRQ